MHDLRYVGLEDQEPAVATLRAIDPEIVEAGRCGDRLQLRRVATAEPVEETLEESRLLGMDRPR